MEHKTYPNDLTMGKGLLMKSFSFEPSNELRMVQISYETGMSKSIKLPVKIFCSKDGGPEAMHLKPGDDTGGHLEEHGIDDKG